MPGKILPMTTVKEHAWMCLEDSGQEDAAFYSETFDESM
jgi:hypothetical protein